MSQKRKRSPEAPARTPGAGDIFRSEPLEDRSSTFIGYYSPALPAKELQSIVEIKSASHKILAWRKQSTQRSITSNATQFNTGHDDDGEKNGGKAVERVLVQMQVAGACVVARWYGGVMLGPVRFTHMEQCTREAVRKWQNHEAEERIKKRRTEDEAVEKQRLVKTLGERDKSIEVLRAMAAEKEKRVKDTLVVGMESLESRGKGMEETSTQGAASAKVDEVSAVKPTIDYAAMAVERLRALDRARDATLSFLLKRIARAEADLAAIDGGGKTKKPP